jgi:hypothetical protein
MAIPPMLIVPSARDRYSHSGRKLGTIACLSLTSLATSFSCSFAFEGGPGSQLVPNPAVHSGLIAAPNATQAPIQNMPEVSTSGSSSNGDALKRVGIRFVDPNKTKSVPQLPEAATSTTTASERSAGIAPDKPSIETIRLPSASISGQGVRIRIPNQTTTNIPANVESSMKPAAIAATPKATLPPATIPQLPIQSPSPMPLKMVVKENNLESHAIAANAAPSALVPMALPKDIAAPALAPTATLTSTQLTKRPSTETKVSASIRENSVSIELPAPSLDGSNSPLNIARKPADPMTEASSSLVVAETESSVTPSLALASESEPQNKPRMDRQPVRVQPSFAPISIKKIETASQPEPELVATLQPQSQAPVKQEVAGSPASIRVIPPATLATAPSAPRSSISPASINVIAPSYTEAIQEQNAFRPTDSFNKAIVNSGSVEVSAKNVTSIKLNSSIEQVRVEDDRVCKAILTDSNSLSVLGVAPGTSKIAIWTDRNEQSSGPSIYQVVVRDSWSATSKSDVSIEDANESIASLFPDAKIVVKALPTGSLVVQGRAENNDTAKQIIMLVRKMFLVPVQDKIAVSSH